MHLCRKIVKYLIVKCIYTLCVATKIRDFSAQNLLNYSVMFGLFFNDCVYFVPFKYGKKKKKIHKTLHMYD